MYHLLTKRLVAGRTRGAASRNLVSEGISRNKMVLSSYSMLLGSQNLSRLLNALWRSLGAHRRSRNLRLGPAEWLVRGLLLRGLRGCLLHEPLRRHQVGRIDGGRWHS